MKKKTKKTVLVGMSGGVDSTMAAFLLKEEGFNVIGATMKIWDGRFKMEGQLKSGCYGPGEEEEIRSAKEAARKIGVRHIVVDLKKEYGETVLDNYIETYLKGKTPNPCVRCNQKIKFGLLLEKAKQSGIDFDYFATGHYVQTSFNPARGRFVLKKSADRIKDQSYFLYRLSQEQLSKLIFPLGSYTKDKIKALARKIGLGELADKHESQDFSECKDKAVFFEDKDVRPGNIIGKDGKILGKHDGIVNFTVGQRKGLDISNNDGALYVIKINAKKNEMIVGTKDDLYCKSLIAEDLNWVAIDNLQEPKKLTGKIRLHQSEQACIVTPQQDGSASVEFETPVMSITPGQSIVFYDSDVVVGGGTISKTI